MDASPYSAAAIASNQATTTTPDNNGKVSKIYPNSLFRLVTPRKLIVFSTCYDCSGKIYHNQKKGGIIHDPITNAVTISIVLCERCVADNQASSFIQVKLTPKTDKEVITTA
uniref:Uncharacterized protein n=1 Tax=Panagrolaimus superbus TaxID=310955 RepID=A0A914YK43_9BILA